MESKGKKKMKKILIEALVLSLIAAALIFVVYTVMLNEEVAEWRNWDGEIVTVNKESN